MSGDGAEVKEALIVKELRAEKFGLGVDAVSVQNVPLTTPDVQDVIDALVNLGLVEQSD
jgi:hypothetical protein